MLLVLSICEVAIVNCPDVFQPWWFSTAQLKCMQLQFYKPHTRPMSYAYKPSKVVQESSVSSPFLGSEVAVGKNPLKFPEIIQVASKQLYMPSASHIQHKDCT